MHIFPTCLHYQGHLSLQNYTTFRKLNILCKLSECYLTEILYSFKFKSSFLIEPDSVNLGRLRAIREECIIWELYGNKRQEISSSETMCRTFPHRIYERLDFRGQGNFLKIWYNFYAFRHYHLNLFIPWTRMWGNGECVPSSPRGQPYLSSLLKQWPSPGSRFDFYRRHIFLVLLRGTAMHIYLCLFTFKKAFIVLISISRW